MYSVVYLIENEVSPPCQSESSRLLLKWFRNLIIVSISLELNLPKINKYPFSLSQSVHILIGLKSSNMDNTPEATTKSNFSSGSKFNASFTVKDTFKSLSFDFASWISSEEISKPQ